MRRRLFLLALCLPLPLHAAQTVVSFDAPFTGPNQHLNDSSLSIGPATFLNTTYESYGSLCWAGYAFSTVSNTTDGSYLNQYAPAQPLPRACAIGYHDYYQSITPTLRFALPAAPKSVQINNTTYAALTLRDGDGYGFSQPFSDGDYFYLTLTATDLDGQVVAATNHTLADFRSGRSFIQTNWSSLDLSWMPPNVASLVGTLTTSDVGTYGPNTPMYFALADFTYAYSSGADGIASTNPAILCWADGWTAYAPGTNVVAQWHTPSNALGAAQGFLHGLGATNGVVSLGDNGSLTLTFPVPIADGPGPDFAVFENAFADSFLELARVEVSSDGTNFVRFPSHCLETNWIDTYTATNASDPSAYAGLAGKHTQGFGTPFDLRALADASDLDPRHVTHVRIVDVLGDGSNTDTYGHPIFDPTPTFGSGGFDLDAVAVLNANLDLAMDGPAPASAPPVIPGLVAVREYNTSLDPTTWSTNTPAANAPACFFRWKWTR